MVEENWDHQTNQSDEATVINAKFKNLRRLFKNRQSNSVGLNFEIIGLKLVLNFCESVEEFSDLSLLEWNFRSIVRDKLTFKLNH